MVKIQIGKFVLKTFDIVIFSILIVIYIIAILIHTPALASLNTWIQNMSNFWAEFAGHAGNALWMAFIFSTFGNTSVLIVFPYAFIVWQISLVYPYWYLLGIISGLGAGIGEVTSYLVGLGIGTSKKIKESEIGEKFMQIKRKFERKPALIPVTVFTFAITPLPDDMILVPFGIMKYPYYKVVVPCMLGKMAMCTLISFLGFLVGTRYPGLADVFPISLLVPSTDANPAQDLISFSLVFWIIWLMVRLDWEQIGIKLNRDRKNLVKYFVSNMEYPTSELEKRLNIVNKERFELFIKELPSKHSFISVNNESIVPKEKLSKTEADQLSITIFRWISS